MIQFPARVRNNLRCLRLRVVAGEKRPHLRRFCSQRKPAIGEDAVRTLYEILNSPWRTAGGGATIEFAPSTPTLMDGTHVIRRAPHADLDTQIVYRLHSFFMAQLFAAQRGLAMQRASSIGADRLYLVVELVRLDTKRYRVSQSSYSC